MVPGDKLLRVGDIDVKGPEFGLEFRQRYAREPRGDDRPDRGGAQADSGSRCRRRSRQVVRVERQFEFLDGANEKARRIRAGLLDGR